MRHTLVAFLLATGCLITHAQNHYLHATENPFSPVWLSHIAAPTLGDIDADGDLDLFVGQYNSNDMLFYRNMGTAQEPMYVEQTGSENPLDIYSSNSGCNGPVLVDIDTDGDLDVFVGNWSYIIRYLRNAGTAEEPDFVFETGANNPLDHVFTEGICSYPAFVDIDADGDLDVFISDGDGNIEYYENTGDTLAPVFVLDTVNNVLGGLALSAGARIVFEDVSGDSLTDVVISQDLAVPELLYFENIGSMGNALFEQRTGTANPFNGITGTEALVPAFADIDDDGDNDLIVGTRSSVELYEAVQTTSVSPVARERTYDIYPNPVTDVFTVKCDALEVVEVINTEGKLIKWQRTTGETTIDMSGKPSGTYFIRLITEKYISVEKIILR